MNRYVVSRTDYKVHIMYVCTVRAVYGYKGDVWNAERVRRGSERMKVIPNGAVRSKSAAVLHCSDGYLDDAMDDTERAAVCVNIVLQDEI